MVGMIFCTLCLLAYLYALTWDEQAAHWLEERPYLLAVVDAINSPAHAQLSRLLDNYCRDYNTKVLQSLRAEMNHWLRLSDNPFAVVVLGVFYTLYAVTWVKVKLWAGRNDLRAVLGLQVFLTRFDERLSH